MNVEKEISKIVFQALKDLYQVTDLPELTINKTRKEFVGEYTLVTFPLTRISRKKPEETASEIGDYLITNHDKIDSYTVVKGFLNLSFSTDWWMNRFLSLSDGGFLEKKASNGGKVMVEFCSPNTNKPLHLGHIRNILLGWSTTKILEHVGFDVIKTQIINDRGIAICKSMLAWRLFGEGESPESTQTKGDHFVGKYYVKFNNELSKEYQIWQLSEEAKVLEKQNAVSEKKSDNFFNDYSNDYFNKHSVLGAKARELLLDWEDKEETAIADWEKMNGWVYSGFDETFRKLGVSFDKLYYESETYLLGKDTVSVGLNSKVFYQKPDNSIWVDLSEEGLDDKLLLRSDGTSVYMTQDLGTAMLRNKDFHPDKMVYVVGDEQEYHFKVLFKILGLLNEPYASGLYHLSYGMVDLPTGKMKSREGTVVDADDLIEEVKKQTILNTSERGEIADLSKEEQEEIVNRIALSALKFFIVKVHPKKRMIFNPAESVDMQGQTGPYVQNAYVRIKSILRKAGEFRKVESVDEILTSEKELIDLLGDFGQIVSDAAAKYDPSVVAQYCYTLAKTLHKYYHDVPILKAGDETTLLFRLKLVEMIAETLYVGMELLGIEMPEKM
jgi:arginyl-tRNA synthetase